MNPPANTEPARKRNVRAKALNADPLLRTMASAYARSSTGDLSNRELFDQLADEQAIDRAELAQRKPVGKAGKPHSLLQRRLRWHQQTLRDLGLLERDPGRRGLWRLTAEGKQQFVRPAPKKVLLGFSTDLGIALWASAQDAFSLIDVPLVLAVTSPPYPTAHPRAYGSPPLHAYTDFICELVEPVVRRLVPGGSIVLNVGQDIFEEDGARSDYVERMVIGLKDRLGLRLVDRLPWVNFSKAPGPVRYASINSTHLNAAWEPVYWFTNNPTCLRADNRRVLQAHSERHAKLLAAGGERRDASYSDGAYTLRAGRSFANQTAGSIPRNVLMHGHACRGQRTYKAACARLGLPAHGAPFPEALARFLVEFMSEVGDVCADFCAGSHTMPAVCEDLGRAWVSTEIMGEYVRGSAERLRGRPGFQIHSDLLEGLARRHEHPTWDGQLALAV